MPVNEALSRLAERGDFTVLEMAAVSGHKTLQMLKRYTHLQAEKLAAKLGQVSQLPAILPATLGAIRLEKVDSYLYSSYC